MLNDKRSISVQHPGAKILSYKGLIEFIFYVGAIDILRYRLSGRAGCL